MLEPSPKAASNPVWIWPGWRPRGKSSGKVGASKLDGIKNRSVYRAEKLLALAARYKVIREGDASLKVSATIEAILNRIPQRDSSSTSEQYLLTVRDAVTWPEVDILEEAVDRIEPASILPLQLAFKRLMYSQMVSDSEYARYERSMLDISRMNRPLAGDDIESMRAEIINLSRRTRYLLRLSPGKERARSALSNRVVRAMLIAMVVLAALYAGTGWIAHHSPNLPTPSPAFFVALGAGLLGGYVSVQQRLQEPTQVDPFYKWLELDASGFSLLYSPIIGMVFAMILYAIFVGAIVTGNLFPGFLECGGMKELMCSFHSIGIPDGPASWGKLVVWSFAAGFLERLVPDILTRIASVANK